MSFCLDEYYLIKFTKQNEHLFRGVGNLSHDNPPEQIRLFNDQYQDMLFSYLDNHAINKEHFVLNNSYRLCEFSFDAGMQYINDKKNYNLNFEEMRTISAIKHKKSFRKNKSLSSVLIKNNFVFLTPPHYITKDYINFIFEHNIEELYLKQTIETSWEFIILFLLLNHKINECELIFNKVESKIDSDILSKFIILWYYYLNSSLSDYLTQNRTKLADFFISAINNIDYDLVKMRMEEYCSPHGVNEEMLIKTHEIIIQLQNILQKNQLNNTLTLFLPKKLKHSRL